MHLESVTWIMQPRGLTPVPPPCCLPSPRCLLLKGRVQSSLCVPGVTPTSSPPRPLSQSGTSSASSNFKGIKKQRLHGSSPFKHDLSETPLPLVFWIQWGGGKRNACVSVDPNPNGSLGRYCLEQFRSKGVQNILEPNFGNLRFISILFPNRK